MDDEINWTKSATRLLLLSLVFVAAVGLSIGLPFWLSDQTSYTFTQLASILGTTASVIFSGLLYLAYREMIKVQNNQTEIQEDQKELQRRQQEVNEAEFNPFVHGDVAFGENRLSLTLTNEQGGRAVNMAVWADVFLGDQHIGEYDLDVQASGTQNTPRITPKLTRLNLADNEKGSDFDDTYELSENWLGGGQTKEFES